MHNTSLQSLLHAKMHTYGHIHRINPLICAWYNIVHCLCVSWNVSVKHLFFYSAAYQCNMLHFKKTCDSSSMVRSYNLTTQKIHTPLELNSQEYRKASLVTIPKYHLALQFMSRLGCWGPWPRPRPQTQGQGHIVCITVHMSHCVGHMVELCKNGWTVWGCRFICAQGTVH